MTTPDEHDRPTLDDVIEPERDPGLPRDPTQHGGMPPVDEQEDEVLEHVVEQDRVAAGLKDYAEDEVPPATEPLPPS
jgi:hypothetical protein